MANISYHVILPQNLALKRLPLKQIEVVLDITGALEGYVNLSIAAGCGCIHC